MLSLDDIMRSLSYRMQWLNPSGVITPKGYVSEIMSSAQLCIIAVVGWIVIELVLISRSAYILLLSSSTPPGHGGRARPSYLSLLFSPIGELFIYACTLIAMAMRWMRRKLRRAALKLVLLLYTLTATQVVDVRDSEVYVPQMRSAVGDRDPL
jgi:hypothetical protein